MTDLVLEVSSLTAVLGSFALSSFFVGSLYLWKLAGYSDTNRDDTGTVQRRFASALLSCVCSACLIAALSRPATEQERGMSLLALLGLSSPEPLAACASCLALTSVLFIGPIVQHFVGVREGSARFAALPGGPWVALRNFVLAPLSEEFVFRACLVRLCVGASFPKAAIIICAPFCFAMAHTHHFIELVRRFKDKKAALLQVAFQVFYTSLFGAYCNFLLLRTGCTPAVILCHTFCNHQGFPELGFLAASGHPLFRHRTWLGVLYLIGIVAFGILIAPLTAGFQSSFNSPMPRTVL